MKSTIVPAQVTTVEDKVAGSLTFTQLLLLITPVFIGGAIFAFLPPLFGFNYIKLAVCSVLALVCMVLAIRIKGMILLHWIVVLARYTLRPRLYLFNKNDMYLRNPLPKPEVELEEKQQTIKVTKEHRSISLHPSQLARVEAVIANPESNLRFKTVKGGMRVIVNQIEKESI